MDIFNYNISEVKEVNINNLNITEIIRKITSYQTNEIIPSNEIYFETQYLQNKNLIYDIDCYIFKNTNEIIKIQIILKNGEVHMFDNCILNDYNFDYTSERIVNLIFHINT